MRGNVDRRLGALERVAGQGGADCERLLAMARDGRITIGDLVHLSDQQLWWIVAGKCSPMPVAALEQMLAEVRYDGQA
jgi:hypothetical protein